MYEGTIARPSADVIRGFSAIPTATISDVLDSMKIGGIVNGFRCLIPSVRIAGCAFTVKSIAGERDTYTAADFPIGKVIEGRVQVFTGEKSQELLCQGKVTTARSIRYPDQAGYQVFHRAWVF